MTAEELNKSQECVCIEIGDFIFELYPDIYSYQRQKLYVYIKDDSDILPRSLLAKGFKTTENAEKALKKEMKKIAKKILRDLENDKR